jgi:hypothetical protein
VRVAVRRRFLILCDGCFCCADDDSSDVPGHRGAECFAWGERGATQCFALVGAIVGWVEPYLLGSGEFGQASFVGFLRHHDVHARFGPHRVGWLRRGLQKDVDEGIRASLCFGATQMGHVRVVAVFGAGGFPIGEPLDSNETFEQFFGEGALGGPVAAVESEPSVELFVDAHVTVLVQGVVTLADAVGVGGVQPVFHDVGELAGVQPPFVF